MENNKAYLKNIHWVFLIGIASGVLITYSPGWFFKEVWGKDASLTVTIIANTAFYTSMGLMLGKWKEAAIAWGISIAFSVLNIYGIRGSSFSFLPQLLSFFIFPLTSLIFIGLVAGWQKRLLPTYFILLFSAGIYITSYYAYEGISAILSIFWDFSGKAEKVFRVIFMTASHIVSMVFICELINYNQGKNNKFKTSLLNIGNDYHKPASLITFWSFKSTMIASVIGGGYYLQNYVQSLSYRSFGEAKAISNYFLVTGSINVLGFICCALFMAWYLRKFMLETFVTYNVQSKFLYWFCQLPIIGFFSYLVIVLDNNKQTRYTDKVSSIGSLAGSSSQGVTAVFFTLMGIRFILRLANGGDPTFLISFIITVLLFIWMISDKIGYYVNVAITALALLVVCLLAFINEWRGPIIPIFFSLLLFNLAQVILVYPVYHFAEFEYIPAENPDPEPEGEFRLFKDNLG